MKRGPEIDNSFKPEISQQRGIAFTWMGKHLRSVYRQLDDSIILADACVCATDWLSTLHYGPSFKVRHLVNCPIDEHRIKATQASSDF